MRLMRRKFYYTIQRSCKGVKITTQVQMKGLASYLSFYYSLILLYCLYDVLTNIYVYLFNVMSLRLSNEVGYNYDAATKGSRL